MEKREKKRKGERRWEWREDREEEKRGEKVIGSGVKKKMRDDKTTKKCLLNSGM